MTDPVPDPWREGEIVRSEPLGELVKRVVIRTPAPFPFRAGQHLALRREREANDSYYSFASSSAGREPFEFELAVAVGTPSAIADLPPGARLWLSPPGGRAVLHGLAARRPLLLVGMGTGIAPLRAVVQENLNLPEPHAVTLVHGCRSESSLLFRDEFVALGAAGALSYVPVLSRPEEHWAGLSGYVQSHLRSYLVEDVFCVVCGSRQMVADVKAELDSLKIGEENLFAEGY